MSILSNKALHEQLSVIMGALTKAAVVEICEVVDEGYAVLQMEISRSHKENEDLRKKLHLIESIVVRGSGGGQAVTGGTELVEVARGGSSLSAEVGRQADSPQQLLDGDQGDAAAVAGGDGEAPGTSQVAREELLDVVLIKDEDSDSNDSEEGNALPADGALSAVSEGIAAAATGRRRRRRSRGSDDAERSASSEQLEVKTSRLLAGTQSQMPVYSLDSPRSEPGCSGQLPEASEAVCSYSAPMDPDVQLVQDCSLVSPGSSRKVYFSSNSMMEDQSPSNRAELDLNADPSWTKQSKGLSFAQFHQSENMDGDAFGLKLISVSGSASTDCQLSSSSSSALEYENGGNMMNYGLYRDQPGRAQLPAGSLRKRFICPICNKTYANAQNLEVHTRIHTGERPFSCDQCGKKFTQSAHLRSHLNIHSGERPFVCTVCSKSFIVKYSLKLHMKKYHPNS